MPLGDPRDWGNYTTGPFDTLEEERRAKGIIICPECKKQRTNEWVFAINIGNYCSLLCLEKSCKRSFNESVEEAKRNGIL
jgi:uncharacterized CHY-type Zn-finger protein